MTNPPDQKFDVLEQFAAWFIENANPIPQSIFNGARRVGNFTGLTLLRAGQFQAQLWICDANSEIPDHSHPSIDTIQVFITGDIQLRLNGEPAITELITCLPNGVSSHNGRWIRVKPTDTHGATIGPAGGAFLNFQHWLKSEPSSAELDWQGEPLSEAHAQMIKP